MKNSLILKTTLLAGSIIGFGYSHIDHSKDEKQELQKTITQDSTSLATIEHEIDCKHDSVQNAYYSHYPKYNKPVPTDLLRDDRLNATHLLNQKTTPLRHLIEQHKSQMQFLNDLDEKTNNLSGFLSGMMFGTFATLGIRSMVKKYKNSRKELDLQ